MMACCHWQQEAKHYSRRWKIGSSATSIVHVITDVLEGFSGDEQAMSLTISQEETT